jgi:hypothetical protein
MNIRVGQKSRKGNIITTATATFTNSTSTAVTNTITKIITYTTQIDNVDKNKIKHRQIVNQNTQNIH